MTPTNCKAFLDAGILQAYADGKPIEHCLGGKWKVMNNDVQFDAKPETYRIKPVPREVRTPFTFEQAIKAIAENGMELTKGTTHKITGIGDSGINIQIHIHGKNGVFLNWMDSMHFTFTNGVPFCTITYEDDTND